MAIERNLMIKMASPSRPPQVDDFINLSIMEKLEVFDYALAGKFQPFWFVRRCSSQLLYLC